mmetsp:Transcript_25139/g.95004  ORF Transcript_25139/g.95004 Transcript_25139/m.95004 type:complete len:295 (+) Transcript_25139:746-1630(+)
MRRLWECTAASTSWWTSCTLGTTFSTTPSAALGEGFLTLRRCFPREWNAIGCGTFHLRGRRAAHSPKCVGEACPTEVQLAPFPFRCSFPQSVTTRMRAKQPRTEHGRRSREGLGRPRLLPGGRCDREQPGPFAQELRAGIVRKRAITVSTVHAVELPNAPGVRRVCRVVGLTPAPVGPIGPGSSPAPARVRPDALAPALLRRCKARMEPNAVERRALPSTCVGRSRNRHAAIVSGGRTSTPSGSCARVPLPRHSHEVERAPVQTAAASIHGRAAEPAAAVPRSLRAGRAHPPGP